MGTDVRTFRSLSDNAYQYWGVSRQRNARVWCVAIYCASADSYFFLDCIWGPQADRAGTGAVYRRLCRLSDPFHWYTASSKEKQTATCPQYAYNEYLQIGLELGITGLLFFIFWLAFSLYYGIRHRQIGASGGILALGIFALYSYPLQLPTYWVLLLFLTTICVTNPKHNKQRAQRSIPYISAIAAILTCILFYGQKDTYYTYREWKTLQELYHNQEYEQAASRYAGLFVQLYHRTDFLYEGAECFYKTGQHDIAIKWLDRALKLSAAPELYYAIAKNEKAIKQYQKAESYLLEISRILPEQGYTYFLLAKLYTNPSFLHPDKFHKAAKRFLAFQPSTQNNITKEMKDQPDNST